jgi:hypothetical protein
VQGVRLAGAFAEGVRGLRGLRSLRLLDHAPLELLCGALCEALRASCASGLTELRLDGSRAGWLPNDAAGDARLASAVSLLPPMPVLALLHVEGVGGARAAAAVARFVAGGRCPRLRSLTLGVCELGVPELGALADALLQPSVAAGLTELGLHFLITHEGVERVLGALGGLAQLQTLDLSLLALDAFPVELVRAIGRLAALRTLKLIVRIGMDNGSGMQPADLAAVVGALQGACTNAALVVTSEPTLEAARAASAAATATLADRTPPSSLRRLLLIVSPRLEHRWLDPAFVRTMTGLDRLTIASTAAAAINVDARSLAESQALLPNLKIMRLQNVRLV